VSPELRPVFVANPELLAPLARAVHHAHCPACQAAVVAVGGDGTQVQVTCLGEPAHAFLFDATTGHIANRPMAYGEVVSGTAG
jgi:hypothetical protein